MYIAMKIMIKSLQFGQKQKPYVYIHVKDYPFSEESQKMLRFCTYHELF
jgi:hypothetical protein